MKIDQIDLYHVAMPMTTPWETSYGVDYDIHSVVIRMTSGDKEGWAETSCFQAPCYSPEYAGGVFKILKEWMADRLIGKDIASGEQLQKEVSVFRGNQFAKAGLDMAWWALQSACTDTPLYRLLGGSNTLIEVGEDFGVKPSLEQLLDEIGEAADKGFARVKLKARPGWDLNVVQAVRKQFPNLVFHIDCNSGYTLDDLDLFKEIDQYGLSMIEQPLMYDDLADHARLQEQMQTPICLDESINSLSKARKAIELGSCRWINIKPGRVGGLTVAKQIHDHAKAKGIPCWVGGMLESAVGASLCVALATLDNFAYAPDVFPSSKFYAQDMASPAIELIKSPANRPAVQVPEVAGTPSLPMADRLEKVTVESATIKG